MAVQSIDELIASVTGLESVVDSAVVLLDGISDRIDQAVKVALKGGASAADLAPFTKLKQDVDGKTKALAAAVAANTPGNS